MPTHWYYITSYYCPICGIMKTTRERNYTPKPQLSDKRYKVIDVYEYCQKTNHNHPTISSSKYGVD